MIRSIVRSAPIVIGATLMFLAGPIDTARASGWTKVGVPIRISQDFPYIVGGATYTPSDDPNISGHAELSSTVSGYDEVGAGESTIMYGAQYKQSYFWSSGVPNSTPPRWKANLTGTTTASAFCANPVRQPVNVTAQAAAGYSFVQAKLFGGLQFPPTNTTTTTLQQDFGPAEDGEGYFVDYERVEIYGYAVTGSQVYTTGSADASASLSWGDAF